MIRSHIAPHTHPRSRSASLTARSLHVLLVACTCILLVVWLVYLVRVEALFSNQAQGHSLRRRAKGLFSGGMPSPLGRGADERSTGLGPRVEVWARGANQQAAGRTEGPRQHLSDSEQLELRSLCARALYHTLEGSVHMYTPQGAPHAFVATGDIPDQWIRDSSVQLGVLLPRIAQHPALRQLVDAAILRQASFILADPWANSFRQAKVLPGSLHVRQQRMGRGGWVATRNYEPDSGAYFINLLWNYYHTPGLWGRKQLLNSSVVHDAVLTTISTWQTEQHHEEKSPYRYSELTRHGRGPKSGYTGMVWGGFRPSDDPQVYSYNIPANMYIAGALDNALWLNSRLWHCPVIRQRAAQLAADIRQGVEQYGIVSVSAGAGSEDTMKVRVYAYEVDGVGNHLADFDDPNLPSLLAMPLLGYSGYDEQVYRATRARILSTANPYYYHGPLGAGCGSPHSTVGYAWPLAIMVDALTTSNTSHQASVLRQLLGMQCGNGLMHESFDVTLNSTRDSDVLCTRDVFEWANAMLVALVEETLGLDCDAEAQRLHLEAIRASHGQLEADVNLYRNRSTDAVTKQRNAHPIVDPDGGDLNDYPLFYARMEQHWDLP